MAKDEDNNRNNKSSAHPHTTGTAGSVDITASKVDNDLAKLALDGELRATRFRAMIGYVLILSGIILTLLGATGSIDWELEIPGISSKVSNAGPGIICLIGGIILAITSTPKIKIR